MSAHCLFIDAIDVTDPAHCTPVIMTPGDSCRTTVDLGVTKVNVNAEVRRAYLRGLPDELAESGDDDTRRVQARPLLRKQTAKARHGHP
jgi:hypothetical protein